MNNKIVYTAIVFVALTGCKSSKKNASSNPSFIEIGAPGLTAATNKPQVNICVSGNSNNRENEVKQIVDSYFAAIVSGANIQPPNVSVGGGGAQNCDASVIFAPVNPAYTNVGSAPEVHIGDNPQEWFGSRGVLVHEFGHAFGLADTYNQASRQAGDCVSGNPKEAAMCSPYYDFPQLDEANGVRSVYKGVNSSYQGQNLSQFNPGNSNGINNNNNNNNNGIGANPIPYQSYPPSVLRPQLPVPHCPPQVVARLTAGNVSLGSGMLSIMIPELVTNMSACFAGLAVCQNPHATKSDGTPVPRFILQNKNPQDAGFIYPSYQSMNVFAQNEYVSGALTSSDRAALQNGIITLQGLTRTNQLFMCETPVVGY